MSSTSSPASRPDPAAPSLTQRPEATTVSIEDLLAWVRAGRVRVPRFQRKLTWEAEHIRLLFDSIYRGYPVGTLLFWKKPAEAAIVEMGPVQLKVPHRQDALWVVDGQQRITALVGVLANELDAATSEYALHFDLAAEALVYPSKRQKPEPTWIPLNRVVDSEALIAWLLERPALGDMKTAAIRLGKRVREYQVPAYIVETEDETPLREIFHRINRGGKPLQEAEVFEALHGAAEEEPSGLREIARQLEHTGFGRIVEKYIHMALLAICDKDVGRGSQLRLARDEARAALPKTQTALLRTIIFLQRNAGIPHMSLLPYKRPLVTLARFFDRYPEPHPRSLMLLARWLWRGAITEQHQGNTVTTRQGLRAIGDNEFQSIDLLLRQVGRERPEARDLSNYNFRHARSKLHTMALLGLQPRHLATGEPLALSELMASGAPAHAITGSTALEPERLHGLANYLVHPPLEGGLRRPLTEQSDPAVLHSHAVSPEAHQALREGDYGRFLERRESDMEVIVTRFLEARAQWSASDRPPIAALRTED